MLEFTIKSVFQHPLTGDADIEYYQIRCSIPELEIKLNERRCVGCGEERVVVGTRIIQEIPCS